ncbi:MAG: hypothetical protein M1118_02575 [Chloroflexi bacterium]|nr:hypothetical protein [Chloroflexota bacterium]
MRPLVVFDLDDTLVDYAGAIDLALSAFATQRGLSEEDLAFLREVNSRPLSVHESWQTIKTHFGFGETADELALAFAAMVPTQTIPFEGVALGLAELFDAMCFCDGDGPRKPEPVVFAEVARRTGAELAGAWMVGDSLHLRHRGRSGRRHDNAVDLRRAAGARRRPTARLRRPQRRRGVPDPARRDGGIEPVACLRNDRTRQVRSRR